MGRTIRPFEKNRFKRAHQFPTVFSGCSVDVINPRQTAPSCANERKLNVF